MGGKHNKCCCSAAVAGDLYMVHEFRVTPFASPTGSVWKYDGETGAGSLFYTSTSANAIACSRDGHVYVEDGTNLKKLDSTGATVWTTSTVGLTTISGIAVGQGGYVYACGLSGRVNRYRTSDGVAVDTGGGGGYGVATGSAVFQGICVDQTEHVWMCGTSSGLLAIFPMTLAGKYGTTKTYILGTDNTFKDIRINEANDTLVVVQNTGSPTTPTIMTVDPTNLASYTTVTHGALMLSCDYAPNGKQYAGGQPNSGGYAVREDGLEYFSSSNRVQALACGGDSSQFIGRTRPSSSPNYSVLRIGYWGVDAGSQYTPIRCDIATGRIGAFGNV